MYIKVTEWLGSYCPNVYILSFGLKAVQKIDATYYAKMSSNQQT